MLRRGRFLQSLGVRLRWQSRKAADPENNGKLRDVIAKAKANNMPNDTIERGIKKAAGNMDAVNYEEVTYEGYNEWDSPYR